MVKALRLGKVISRIGKASVQSERFFRLTSGPEHLRKAQPMGGIIKDLVVGYNGPPPNRPKPPAGSNTGMRASRSNCPNCGGPMRTNHCDFCGSVVPVSGLDNGIPITPGEISVNQIEKIKSQFESRYRGPG